MSHWQIRPMQTLGLSEDPWNYWILFRQGQIEQPVAVFTDPEMKQLVEHYHEYEQRKASRSSGPSN